MLVLTRKKDESIIINDEIEIVVVDISPTQVRLGIKAPRNMEVFRKEIYVAVQEENKQAARSTAEAGELKEKMGSELKGLFKNEK